MSKWKYKNVTLSPSDHFINRCNKEGQERWELVDVEGLLNEFGNLKILYLTFKREIIEDKTAEMIQEIESLKHDIIEGSFAGGYNKGLSDAIDKIK